MNLTPAAQARQRAGLTIEAAAKQAGVCPDYLRRIERLGGCSAVSYPLAMRLARLYRCSANVFLTISGDATRRNAHLRKPNKKRA